MAPKLFGIEHILYFLITTLLGSVGLILARKYAKKEKTQILILKILAGFLFIFVMANRLAQVFSNSTIRWYYIIPDSFCAMTSLVLSLAVLFGKKNNCVYHFVWLLGLFGGISTVIYASFIEYNAVFFCVPTITGLLHHSICATLVVALLMFNQIEITYKKWYCTLFGFTCYLTVGAFLMQTFNLSDAFHIAEPLISGTPLTAWFMAPIYAVAYAIILLLIEFFKKRKKNNL